MKARWHEVTAILGGSFDPPHQGHIEAVRGLQEFPGIHRLRVLPSPIPPQKACAATAEQRLEMARLAFSSSGGMPEIVIDTREVERARTQSAKPTYTFDTLSELRREIPNLAFVIGTDQLENLHTWYRFSEVLSLCHWIVLLRKPHGELKAQATLQEWQAAGLARTVQGEFRDEFEILGQTRLLLVPTPAPSLSSTEIREAIGRTGLPPENALPPSVLTYLKLHRIYGMRSV